MLNHYVPRKISEISKTDNRVAVIGTVVDKKENSFLLRNGNAEVEIETDKQIEKNKLVRVFCSVTDGKLKADIVQSLNGLDLNLFKKVEELYSKAGV